MTNRYAVCRKCGYRISVKELTLLSIMELLGARISPAVKYCINDDDEFGEEHDYIYEEG